MSLLGFLFERNKNDGRSATQTPSVPDAVGSSSFDAEDSIHGEPNIDQIREELAEIAKLIGPGDSYDMLAETDLNMTSVDITMGEIKRLIPHAFNTARIAEVDDSKLVTVLFSDLYDQLQSGEVTAPISQLVADIDDDHLAENYSDIKEDLVGLPLQLVVNSVRPEELSKRTTKVERDPELSEMPDVFSLPGLSRGAAPSVPENRMPVVEPVVEDRTIPFRPAAEENEQERDDAQEAAEEAVEELVEDHAEELVEEPAEELVQEPAEEPADELAEDVVPAFEIPESIPLAPREEVIEEMPAPVADEAPAEAAFTGFEIPESIPLQRPGQHEAAAEMPGAPSEPSMEDLEHMMRQAEADAKPSHYNPPVEDVPVVAEPSSSSEVLVRGLDINRAQPEDLVARMDGIGPKIAVRIVEDREINGRFTDAYDLARVQGIGTKIFESITGLAWREDLCGRREILSNILDSSKDSIPDIKGVAQRMANIKGFEGCVIVHTEGYVLASSWNHERNEALGAFAPQMFKKVVQYIRRLELGEMDAFTFFFEEYPITLVSQGDIILASIHTANRFSRRHVQIARSLAAELSRRLQRMRDI